jgi:inorganic triphosphatase YgiF
LNWRRRLCELSKSYHSFEQLRQRQRLQTRSQSIFDTNKQKLRQKRLMLRVRREGRRYTQTIKSSSSSGVFQRDEWETEIASKETDLMLSTGVARRPQPPSAKCHSSVVPLMPSQYLNKDVGDKGNPADRGNQPDRQTR